MRTARSSAALALVAAPLLLLAACADAPAGDAAAGPATAAPPPTVAPPPTDDVALPETDAAPPPAEPTSASGSPGYSHYVFEEVDDDVVLTLVEGPASGQVRCQEVALPCSYADLGALAASGDPVPDGVGVDDEELPALVAQLDAANAALDRYEDVDVACADGFRRTTDQTPNMGAHFYNQARIHDGGHFDPAEPEVALYAAVGDGPPPRGTELGRCVGDEWVGADMELVGFTYILLTQDVGDEHPDAFVGDLDNWHIHHNLCTGPSFAEGGALPADVCRERHGNFVPEHGWMIHAWVHDDFDNQLGVFSMWNPTIWPIAEVTDGFAPRTVAPEGVDAFLSINDFTFGDLTVEPGEPIVIANGDAAPHTVTADEPGRFDSGVFGPGQSFELTLDEPGTYPYYCALHPSMTGTITVEGS